MLSPAGQRPPRGPEFRVVLAVEPIRPGEEEAPAALRLPARMRRSYGPRFFDVVTVVAWYAQGPWLRAVQKLGRVGGVLRQERFEICQEARALRGPHPAACRESDPRPVQAWSVKDLTFTEPALGPVRVVMTDERWQEVHQVGDRRLSKPRQSHWRWLVTRELEGYDEHTIWQTGHSRWAIKNHVFNVLPQHYHLTHCHHHHPVAILAWWLILVLGFVVFGVFARIHGKLLAVVRLTRSAIIEQLRSALERHEDLQPLGSG